MQSFLRRFAPVVMGVLSCLDKVRFRGAIRWLAKPAGMANRDGAGSHRARPACRVSDEQDR